MTTRKDRSALALLSCYLLDTLENMCLVFGFDSSIL